ncbi:DUF317 domain-containing protein [Streptomyces sp. NPDC005009]
MRLAYLTALDGKAASNLPDGDDDGLWRINAYKDVFSPPALGICSNDSAPTEFVTAFTTALAEAYQQGPDHYEVIPDQAKRTGRSTTPWVGPCSSYRDSGRRRRNFSRCSARFSASAPQISLGVL